MQAKYFPDTDTLLLQFNDREIAETRDVNKYMRLIENEMWS